MERKEILCLRCPICGKISLLEDDKNEYEKVGPYEINQVVNHKCHWCEEDRTSFLGLLKMKEEETK